LTDRCIFGLMRVWAFPSFYPYDHPGMQHTGIFAHRQYKALIANGAELQVVIPVLWHPPFPFSALHPEWKAYSKLNYPPERVYDGITVHHPRISNMRPNRFVKKSYEERYIEAIVGLFRSKQITLDPKEDIFYSQWLPSCVMVQEAAHRLGIRSAILAIGDDVALWPQSSEQNLKTFKELFRAADLRFAVSDDIAIRANKIAGTDLPYTVIGRNVRTDHFKPAPASQKQLLRQEYHIDPDRVVILNVGNGSPRKGWIDLMDALQQIKKHNDNFTLVAVHTPPDEISFEEEIRKRGSEHHFLDLGERPPEQLNRIYDMADIFCLPSHAEGLANVVLEAMSSGLAVITTAVGGHPEIIDNGVNGILVAPQQPAELASALGRLMADADDRERMGKAARDFILNKWGDPSRTLYQKLAEVLK
jgi:glycosyltransferase involved in cell wall biosynthesis